MTGYSLLTYQAESGARAGLAIGGTVYDAAEACGNPLYASVLSIIQDWARAEPLLEAQASRRTGRPIGPIEAVQLLTPIAAPAIYCAGANYRAHVQNMEAASGIDAETVDGSINPWFFLKTSHTLAGPGSTIARPSAYLDWEGELAVIIGKSARRVSEHEALDHVAGYTVVNDLSARDIMHRDKAGEGSPFYYDWVSQKCFDGACPIGPWIVPASAIPDPQRLSLQTRVNGAIKQNSNTSQMIYSIARQIVFLSSRFTLHPGDLILTGTPSGVGMETGQSLSAGDEVTVSVENVGDLTNYIS